MTIRKLASGGSVNPSIPLSPGIAAGGFVFVSGQVGIDPTSGSIADGVRAQTRLALANIEHILAQAGLTRAAVVRTTVYLLDITEFAAMNEEYGAFFSEPRPTRTTVGIAGLAVAGLLVEIDAIAVTSTEGA